MKINIFQVLKIINTKWKVEMKSFEWHLGYKIYKSNQYILFILIIKTKHLNLINII